jgi:pilus assembly protein CpaD
MHRKETKMPPGALTDTSHHPWRSATRVATVALVGAWLAACKTTETADTIPYPYDYRERHPITLQEGARTVELFVGRHRAGLNPTQRADVAAFAQSWHRDATGGIQIRVPSGAGNEHAAHETVSEIQGILVAAGVPRNGIAVRPSRPADPVQLLPIVLAYPRIRAAAGPCGRWPNDLGPGAGIDYDTNIPYWNLGCAMQRNLASMVDNPADLVQPRGESPAYTARRSMVLDKYRKGEPTAAQNPDANKGKISDVGK